MVFSGENFYNEMDYTNGGSQLEKDIQVRIHSYFSLRSSLNRPIRYVKLRLKDLHYFVLNFMYGLCCD